MTTPRIPQTKSSAYRAAAHIYTFGPLTQGALFSAIKCGTRPHNRHLMMESALRSGWLIEAAGLIDIGDIAMMHFGGSESVVKPLGQIATSRMSSAYDRPPLSKRFIPSSQGFRDDVPAFSVRVGVHFHTQA